MSGRWKVSKESRGVIKGGAGSMRGQSVAVTIYPSPLPSPRPPGGSDGRAAALFVPLQILR